MTGKVKIVLKQKQLFSNMSLASLLSSNQIGKEPSQTSKMELSVKKVKDWKPLTIFTKNSILDVLTFSGFAHVQV